MNRVINNWKELDAEFSRQDLEKSKSGSIAFLEDKDKFNNWKIYHAHWEDWLSSSDYWKNWRKRIKSFSTPKEVGFYTDRLRAFIDFVKDHTRKDIRYGDLTNIPEFMSNKLKELENISEEEFNKTDKWRKEGPIFKELSTKEMLNDPWFSKQIDNILGLENGENVNPEIKKRKKTAEQNKENPSVKQEKSENKKVVFNKPNQNKDRKSFSKADQNEELEIKNLSSSDKEKETNQPNFSQKTDNKEEEKSKLAANQPSSLQNSNKKNNQNIYYGVGLISLVLLVISIVAVWAKKKR